MRFGEKLRKARKAMNLSQVELAALTGVSERSLYTYEQLGILPRKSNIKKIADALNVTVDYLTDESMENPGATFEEEALLRQAEKERGRKAAKEFNEVLERASALLAGGDLDPDAKQLFMDSLLQVYLESKKMASEKFTPYSLRKEETGDTEN